MSKKIIIIPEFASSHLLKCAIPNWIDVLEPDIIIINSGIFPGGIENKKAIDDDFRKKWCYSGSNAGFDFNETLKFVTQLTEEKYKGDSKIPHIECRVLNYKSNDANECFLEAISNGLESLVTEGNIVFPLEPDVLFHQDDKEIIQSLISELNPGEGLKCKWVDFLETQFYTEAINMSNHKYRRFCYSFDTMKNYREAMNSFMGQDYSKLKKTNEFFARHYPWWCPPKWKELRYELIWRSDPKYWIEFEKGLQEIRYLSLGFKPQYLEEFHTKILIRPSRQDEGRWAKFIDISHPKHIENHENFVK